MLLTIIKILRKGFLSYIYILAMFILISCQSSVDENSISPENSSEVNNSKLEVNEDRQLSLQESEVVIVTQSIPMSASPDMVPINFTYFWFEARQTAPNNISLGQTEDSDLLTDEELSSGEINRTPKREEMLETVKQWLLEREWEEIEQGEEWYNLHFRRSMLNAQRETTTSSNQSEEIPSGIQLFRMYQENFIEAEARYKGKVLTLNGIVAHIAPDTDATGSTVGALVYIHDENTPNGNGGLVLQVNEEEQLFGLKTGESITFTCTVGDWYGVPTLLLSLDNCSIQ